MLRLAPRAIAAFVVCSAVSVASAAVITANVGRDTQIRGGWAADTPAGANTDLYPTSNTGAVAENYIVLLGFDISAVEADVNAATLKLYKVNATPSLAISYTAYKGEQNDWVESEATYNNRKAATAWGANDLNLTSLLASAPSTATTGGATWVDLDVTALVQDMKDDGFAYATFLVKSNNPAATVSNSRITAKEATMWTSTNPNAPTDKFARLVVDSEAAVPEPASLGLLALAGLALCRRR